MTTPTTIRDVAMEMSRVISKDVGADVQITFFCDEPLKFSVFTLSKDGYDKALTVLGQTATALALESEEVYEADGDETEYYAYFVA